MTGVIVTGHRHFPTGLLSAIALMAGRPENTAEVDFPEGCGPSDLKEAMMGSIKALEREEILILVDLMSGTPFNVAAALREELRDRRIKMMAGINIAGLVEAVFSRPVYGLGELAAAVLAAGRKGVRDLDCLNSEEQEPEFEDGLQRI